ncbi:MAG: hypothetical protein JXR37_01500 [Kiritimatiellae bacterium]|nr:hypothetical protein [Kiritimatiellia bacterium]
MADGVFAKDLGESLERLSNQPVAYRTLLQNAGAFGRLPSSLRVELLELVTGDPTPDRIRVWLDLPERLAVALDVRVVVALDEFQELASLTSARKGLDTFSVTRSVWQKHRRTAYFISGSARTMLLRLV